MIKNITKNKIIVKEKKICNSIFSRAFGLMFTKKNNNLGLIFKFNKEQIIPMHMLFVFYPIDVLFLNKEKKVVEIKKSFKPWTFYTPKKKAMYVIEIASNNHEIDIGDKINW